MKKYISFAIIILTTILFALTAYADGISVTLYYTPEEKNLNLKGNATGYTTVIITDENNPRDVLSDANPPVDFLQFNAGGEYSLDITMPDNISSGKYFCFISDENESIEDSFIYFDIEKANQIIQNMNPKNIKDVVATSGADLGVDINDADHSDYVLTLMENMYTSYSGAIEFYNRYNLCKAISSLKGKSKSVIEQNLEKYENVLGISYADDYVNNLALNDNLKTKLCTKLSEMDYVKEGAETTTICTSDSFKNVYDGLIALVTVTSSGSWKAMSGIYSENQFLKNFVVSKNSSYQKKLDDTIFSLMYNMEFNSVKSLKTNFDNAVNQALSPDNQQGSASKPGNTTSFTGPSSSSTAGAGASYETIPEDKKNQTGAKVPVLNDNRAQFSDVTQDSWYYDAVSLLGGNNIINGYEDSSFLPDGYITRAEFSKLIAVSFAITASHTSFDDVSDDSWYASYVKNLAGVGIITGYDGKFNPEQNISRQDAALIIYRLADSLGRGYKGFKASPDMDLVSVYAYSAVGSLYENEIIKGDAAGNFNPLNNITRAEAAQMIFNIIKNMSGA